MSLLLSYWILFCKALLNILLNLDIRSVLKAKRRLLKYPDGFKAQFYTLSEIVTPVLAWGFFGKVALTLRLYNTFAIKTINGVFFRSGPDENLNTLMNFFKDQMLGYVRDLFSFHIVR